MPRQGLVRLAAFKADDAASEGGTSTATSVRTINPYQLLDVERSALAERFPQLSERELDRLWFKIADIKSQDTSD